MKRIPNFSLRRSSQRPFDGAKKPTPLHTAVPNGAAFFFAFKARTNDSASWSIDKKPIETFTVRVSLTGRSG